MRSAALLALLLVAASCASGPTENEKLQAAIERADREAAELRLKAFLSKTPFELCKADPELVKRYGGMKDCKTGIRDEQQRVRDALARQRAEQEARRNLILQHYLRKNFR